MRGLDGDLGFGALEAAVEVGVSVLGWIDERVTWEVENYRDEIKRLTGFTGFL
jgi:hypothetical protein